MGILAAVKNQAVHLTRLARAAVRDRAHGVPRSPQWPKVEHAFRAAHPTCEACGGTDRLQVHHRRPFHLDPALELDPNNLIGLCMAKGCHAHLMLGHGDDFKACVIRVPDFAAQALAARQRGDLSAVTKLEADAKAVRTYAL